MANNDFERADDYNYNEVLKSFEEFKRNLNAFDLSSTQWSNQLAVELDNFSKINLMSKLGNEETSELTDALSSLQAEAVQPLHIRTTKHDFRRLEEDILDISNLVVDAKIKGSGRVERLLRSLNDLKQAQIEVATTQLDLFKSECGLKRIESKLSDHQLVMSRLKEELSTKKSLLIDKNPNTNIDNLKSKYEAHKQEEMRQLVKLIDSHKHEITQLEGTVAIKRLDLEKYTLTIEEMLQGVDTPQCDEASYVLQDDEFIPHIYDLLRSGYISQHVVDDSKGYVGIITSDIKRLSTLIEAAGKREHQKSKALSDFYESEEMKAFERLRKMTDGLEIKIDSDLKRIDAIEGIANQISRAKADRGGAIVESEVQQGNNSSVHKEPLTQPFLVGHRQRLDTPCLRLISTGKSEGDVSVLYSFQRSEHSRAVFFNRYGHHYKRLNEAAAASMHPTSINIDNKKSGTIKMGRANMTSAQCPLNLIRVGIEKNSQSISTKHVKSIKSIIDLFSEQSASLALDSSYLKIQKDELISGHGDDVSEPSDNRISSFDAINNRSNCSSSSSSQINQRKDRSYQTVESGNGTMPFTAAHGGSASIPNKSHTFTNAYVDYRQNRSMSCYQPQNESSQTHSGYSDIGVGSAIEQLEVLTDLLQNWKGASAFSEPLNPSVVNTDTPHGVNNPLVTDYGVGEEQISANMEARLKNIDALHLQIEQFVNRVKLVYRNGAQVKHVIKKLRGAASVELRKCDLLRNDLLALTADAHWTSAFKAGEYHLDIIDGLPRVENLKVQIKNIDREISRQRKKNMKLSDSIVESMAFT